ncbi:TetR/AcrR family transcriptional regulator [Agrobacterium sp. lyk4-40-TYG-31]|uniref:TetR/AcrR family transcriptional regulator n=1 Tax=Agrobacterium sp. lyk4-40-TYG-31 TaxID=3040276 RepID=UPI000DCFCC51|nr:TetR/AcrR family transcriptional regulator [Agrobacterium sp. lyk4-40-TYG-31]
MASRLRGNVAASPKKISVDPSAAEAPEQTRQKILNAALPIFYDKGYRGTSLNAIAKEVGISAPALYWHFKAKRDICFAAVHDELRRFSYALLPSGQENTPEVRLGQFVRTYVFLKLQQNERLKEPGALGAYRQLYDALTKKQQGQLDAIQRQIYELLNKILSSGLEAGLFRFGDQTATSFAIITMCEYVFSWAHPQGRLSASDVADLYKNLVLSMVGYDPK